MVEVSSSGWRSTCHQHPRWLMGLLTMHRTLVLALWVVGFCLVFGWQVSSIDGITLFRRRVAVARPLPRLRPVAFNLTDFGGVGDGKTLNTAAFERAVEAISKLGSRGGGQLNVPAGLWLTAPFNLTSHMTLFLAEDAVILGLEDESYWPLMPPLPSYGYGREHKGPRYGSLIHGQNLKDIVITDSCEDVLIENSYICVGDDAVAIKSGWDQYGIAYGHPSTNITLRNLTVRSVVRLCNCSDILHVTISIDDSAGVSIGSEMSGGVSNVTVDNLIVWESRRGIRIKTAPGRGGYIRNITYRNVTLNNVRVGIMIKTDYNEHPDEGFDPKAMPIIANISFSGIHGQGVRVPVRIHGSEDIPVKDVSFQDMSVGLTYKKKHIFQCSFIEGRVIGPIFPSPCENLDLYDEQGNLVKQAVSQNITDIDYDI
ncbi:Glycosyl hydrolases family 28 [Musa troglodytarum]|uniref:Glycosyl hydrolases family 28 n=1 Tax=Musa troglodytarum TaxID=320322 RepID=A0A9E7FYW9_9LILI|nr:Glycosyl hydrolases family 28 [Musa troglodytarum]